MLTLLCPNWLEARKRARPPLLRGKNSLICGMIDEVA
jgi:hypothetical protein